MFHTFAVDASGWRPIIFFAIVSCLLFLLIFVSINVTAPFAYGLCWICRSALRLKGLPAMPGQVEKRSPYTCFLHLVIWSLQCHRCLTDVWVQRRFRGRGSLRIMEAFTKRWSVFRCWPSVVRIREAPSRASRKSGNKGKLAYRVLMSVARIWGGMAGQFLTGWLLSKQDQQNVTSWINVVDNGCQN